MTRIAFVTDQHFDLHSRFEETIRIHNWIADDAAERGCTLTLLGGDLYERARSTAEERNAVSAWVLRMASFGAVVAVDGNHDGENESKILNLLEAPHPICFHDRPAVQVVQGVAIACLPWPRKAHLLATFGGTGLEEVNNTAQHHLRNILRGLGSELDQYKGMPRIGLGHVNIDGAKTDHDQPLVGSDMSLSLADLGLLRCHLYLWGHIHAQQESFIDNAPSLYGGAPRHNNFGEPGPKGYVVAEFDGQQVVSWERVTTPATPMWLLTARWENGAIVMDKPLPDIRGSETRLRFSVPVDQREAAAVAAARLRDHMVKDLGAVWVKTEEDVLTTRRARAPEVALATTVDAKLVAHWDSIKFDPGERRTELLDKVLILEGEALNAA